MLGHGGRERQEEKIRPKTGGDSKALAGGRHVDRDRTFQVKPHAYRYHGDRGELLEKGVHLHSTKDRYSFDDTINSKVLCFAFGLVAEIERNLISARTKEALAARREQGVILGRRKGSYTKLQRLINAGDRHDMRAVQGGTKHVRSFQGDISAIYGKRGQTKLQFRSRKPDKRVKYYINYGERIRHVITKISCESLSCHAERVQ